MKLLDKMIKAMESGEYEQGRGALCRYTFDGEVIGYCCLGVVTHLHNPQHELLTRSPDDSYKSRAFYMPNDVKERIEKEDPDVMFKEQGNSGNGEPEWDIYVDNFTSAAKLNDKGLSFKEIAAEIKRRYR